MTRPSSNPAAWDQVPYPATYTPEQLGLPTFLEPARIRQVRFPEQFVAQLHTETGETITGRIVDGRELVTLPGRDEIDLGRVSELVRDDSPVALAEVTHAAYLGSLEGARAAGLRTRFMQDLLDLLAFIAGEGKLDELSKGLADGGMIEVDVFVHSTPTAARVRKVDARVSGRGEEEPAPREPLEKVLRLLLVAHGSAGAEVRIR